MKTWHLIPLLCGLWCAWVLLDAVPNYGKCGKCGVKGSPQETAQSAAEDGATATIRIAGDNPQLPGAVAIANQRMTHIGVAFQLVPRNAAADVTVDFVDNINPPGAGGSYMGNGVIHISNRRRSNDLAGILIHEAIHAGGYLWHDDEMSSVMYSTTEHGREISSAHVAALRSLAGSGGGLWGLLGL